MSRSYPLKVEQLEDRCVPATTPFAFSAFVHMPRMDLDIKIDVRPPTSPGAEETFHFVIDAFLINPNSPSTPPAPLTFDFTLPLDRFWNFGGDTIFPKPDPAPTPTPTPTPTPPPIVPPPPGGHVPPPV